MRRLMIVSAAMLAVSGCHAKETEKPRILNAWVRLPAVPGHPAAGYFTVKGSNRDDRLVRIDSAVVKKIEMHESMNMNGMMSMAPMPSLPVPEGTKIEFAPGGKHAMLFDVDPRITAGTAIPMLFTFASGAAVEAEAKTVPAGADMGG